MPPKRNQNRRKPLNKNTRKSEEAVESTIGELECFLPQDLMVAILSRLPVKSLARFKCVCKPWLHLFSNPKFIKTHYDLFSAAPKKCSVQTHLLKCPRLGIDPTKNPGNLKPLDIIVETCKGLVFMSRPSFTKELLLWNPATNLWKFLPLSKMKFGATEMISLGFGCNQEGDDYKVVRIFCLKGRRMKVGVEVYSSKSDSWKTIGVPFKFVVLAPKNHVIANGNPYWMAGIDEKSKLVEGKQPIVLLGFDSTKMSFKIVPLPMFDGDGGMPFVDWKGCVGVLKCVKRDDGCLESIEAWVCEDATTVWTRVETFGGIDLQVQRCLDCSRSGKIIGCCTDGKKFFVYDSSKNRVVGGGEVSSAITLNLQMLPYNESLAFINGMESMLSMKVENKHEHGNPFNANNIDGFFVSCRAIACYYPLAF